MDIEIISFKEELSEHFTELNLAWLKKYFVVEEIDNRMLSDPQKYIIDKDGFIFFAVIDKNVRGTFALIKVDEHVYELSKMAVDPAFQGKKIGNEMLKFCIEEAKKLHATKLILYSNTKLQPAIHLYRKFGFKETKIDNTEYERANIKMELCLAKTNPTSNSKIQNLFLTKKKTILSIYCTAGFPNLDSTAEVLHSLQQYGADLIEIGMPYSDPIADGPVIQHSNMIALQNGITITKLFQQLDDLKNSYPSSDKERLHIPLILMGYLNPVMQYGIEKFCKSTKDAGIDGIILPDLPIYEFETQYQQIFQQYDLDFIFLITPETSEERIRKIDELSKGFIYAVSSSSTTGNYKNMQQQQEYFKRLQQMNLKNPVLVGFGIKDSQTFRQACEYTNGAIIGTAYINAIEKADNIAEATKEFLNKILN